MREVQVGSVSFENRAEESVDLRHGDWPLRRWFVQDSGVRPTGATAFLRQARIARSRALRSPAGTPRLRYTNDVIQSISGMPVDTVREDATAFLDQVLPEYREAFAC